MNSKETFIKKSLDTISLIYEFIKSKESIHIKNINPDKTAFVMMDMINGFAKEGALFSPRIKDLIPEIVSLSKMCDKLNIKKIAFSDYHDEDSPEFSAYPCHCLKDTEESRVVSELEEVGNYHLINKNSTNGFLEPLFQDWIKEHKDIDTFIVVGDCTDICIQQFVVTLKTHFNRLNKKSRIIVPMNAVDTFDLDMHDANLLNLMSLYQMAASDIEIVSNIIE